MKNERWIVRAIDAVMLTPTMWFDRTNGRTVLKLLALVWFVTLAVPCLAVGGLLIFPCMLLMIWDDMK